MNDNDLSNVCYWLQHDPRVTPLVQDMLTRFPRKDIGTLAEWLYEDLDALGIETTPDGTLYSRPALYNALWEIVA